MGCSTATTETITGWFRERMPEGWFTGPVEVTVDREEILVIGALPEGVSPRDFREETREARVGIARQAEPLYQRKVSWGVRFGDRELRYTALAVPIMTRLRIEERTVLDTLIEGGLARSRSEALGWCVRLVASHEADWIAELAQANAGVAEVRDRGPQPR